MHDEMAAIQTNLARVFSRRGDTTNALRSAARALEIAETALGSTHPHLAETLLQLASHELTTGQLEDARAHAFRVLQLDAVPARLRARAALCLAKLDALGHPSKPPGTWLAIAAQELEQSPSNDRDSEVARSLRRWQLDWKSKRSRLRRRSTGTSAPTRAPSR